MFLSKLIPDVQAPNPVPKGDKPLHFSLLSK